MTIALIGATRRKKTPRWHLQVYESKAAMLAFRKLEEDIVRSAVRKSGC